MYSVHSVECDVLDVLVKCQYLLRESKMKSESFFWTEGVQLDWSTVELDWSTVEFQSKRYSSSLAVMTERRQEGSVF